MLSDRSLFLTLHLPTGLELEHREASRVPDPDASIISILVPDVGVAELTGLYVRKVLVERSRGETIIAVQRADMRDRRVHQGAVTASFSAR